MKVGSLGAAIIAVMLVLVSGKGAYADALSARYSPDGINWSTESAFAPPVEPGQGSLGLPTGSLDVNSTIRTHSGGTGMLYVEVTLENVGTNVPPSWFLELGPTLTGTGATVIMSIFFDDANELSDSSPNGSNLGPVSTFGADSVDGEAEAAALRFSCTDCAIGTETTGDALLTPVPEPASLVLLSTGLVSLAVWGRRQRNKN